jgi:DNA-3-methyladenine glycosylase
MKILSREFYERDPAGVARELLGKILVRRLNNTVLKGRIVEAEAYYGHNDPASKAYRGRKRFNELMFRDSGKTFIYMVHGNWLLNIVAHPIGGVGAVLIRALEPLEGVEAMMRNRGVQDIHSLTNGPGKLTEAMMITNKLNGVDVTDSNSEIQILESVEENFNIKDSYRIGVKKDLPVKLRFYIAENRFVSKP